MFVRLALLVAAGLGDLEKPEPVMVALALLESGSFADAYGSGAGPTAHAMPLFPMILAGLIAIFGVGTIGAFAISFSACVCACVAYALLPKLSLASGLGLAPGVLGGLAGALLPINFWVQTSGLFEAPYTAMLLAALCCVMAQCWTDQDFRLRKGFQLGLIGGIAALVNPVVLQVLAIWPIVTLWHVPARRTQILKFCAMGTLTTAAVLAPWAIRNSLTFGRTIWTRSNLGLELHLSNNDYSSPDGEWNFKQNPYWRSMHPFTSAVERARVREIGELAYHDKKREQALKWIRANPARFTLLTGHRMGLFWFPRMRRTWQTAAQMLLTLLALCGAAWLSLERKSIAALFSAVLLAYPAVYYVLQASPRYRYPIEPVLLLLGSYAFLRCVGLLSAFGKSDRVPAHRTVVTGT